MGENYFIPFGFELDDDSLFAVRWVGDNYMVFNGCPDRTDPVTLDFIQVSSWGFATDIGSSLIGIDSKLSVGIGCSSSSSDIAVVSASRSVLDAPNFAPYEPFYFLSFLVFSIFLMVSAFKLIFGKGWQ